MKKIFLSIMILLCALFVTAPQHVSAAFAERPVGFVVIDKSGNVDGQVYSSWREVVKWAYHFPDYKITDSSLPQQNVAAALRDDVKVTDTLLASLAEQSQVDVLVVAVVYDMNDYITSGGFGFRDDSSTYVRVEAAVDLYVYKKDGNKFLKDRIRERELREMGNYERPEHTIRMAISKLVNTMEGRPIIGSGN